MWTQDFPKKKHDKDVKFEKKMMILMMTENISLLSSAMKTESHFAIS
jgi:hypothetical protein